MTYDLWNFCYTYNCLPTHAWYCGLALLLAPTVANFLWNKGGWIQNRAYTLAMWCMFCAGRSACSRRASAARVRERLCRAVALNNPTVNLAVSLIALVANIGGLAYVVYRAKKLGVNPYKHEVFTGTRDWEQARARIAEGEISA